MVYTININYNLSRSVTFNYTSSIFINEKVENVDVSYDEISSIYILAV